MGLLDRILTTARIVTSSLGASNGSVLVNVRVSAEGDTEGQDGSTEEPLFAGPVLFRPLDETPDGAAETYVARIQDGLQPLTVRDLRLSKIRGAMNKGVVSLPGYGGASVSVDYQAASGTDTVTVYVPDDSTPKKAHVAMLDKDQLLFLHKAGHYIALLPDGTISLVSPNGQNFITVSNTGIAISGPIKNVTGQLSGNVAAAQPLMLAPALLAWVVEVNTALAALNLAVGGMVPAIVVPTASPMPATMASST